MCTHGKKAQMSLLVEVAKKATASKTYQHRSAALVILNILFLHDTNQPVCTVAFPVHLLTGSLPASTDCVLAECQFRGRRLQNRQAN